MCPFLSRPPSTEKWRHLFPKEAIGRTRSACHWRDLTTCWSRSKAGMKNCSGIRGLRCDTGQEGVFLACRLFLLATQVIGHTKGEPKVVLAIASAIGKTGTNIVHLDGAKAKSPQEGQVQPSTNLHGKRILAVRYP